MKWLQPRALEYVATLAIGTVTGMLEETSWKVLSEQVGGVAVRQVILSIEALEDYHRMCRRIIGLQDNPRRWESIANLTKAFYYGGGYYFFRDAQRPEPEDSTFSKFLALVDKHATRQRDTGFYADRLCITPKYLSRLVKQKTGKTAKEMILGCVLLRARTMLLNTDLNVQQIADQLGFPSQSVFGKFFKNRTGLSPTECRNTTGR